MAFSNRYIIGFSLVLCLVCSLAVSSLAVSLQDRQAANRRHDMQMNILHVSGLVPPGESCTTEEAEALFEEIRVLKVDRRSGEVVEEIPFGTYDPIAAAKDRETSAATESDVAGDAQVRRVPDHLIVYEIAREGQESYVIPVYGNGLWSTMYGYLALEEDLRTVKGITFYDHGETPGLGGEIDNPRWKRQWPGKELYDEDGDLAIRVTKYGKAQDPEHDVDGLSGATITSRGVSATVRHWLGEEGYGPWLERQDA